MFITIVENSTLQKFVFFSPNKMKLANLNFSVFITVCLLLVVCVLSQEAKNNRPSPRSKPTTTKPMPLKEYLAKHGKNWKKCEDECHEIDGDDYDEGSYCVLLDGIRDEGITACVSECMRKYGETNLQFPLQICNIFMCQLIV